MIFMTNMTKQELYLKTVFCCMACDGDIAVEEIDLVKDLSAQSDELKGLDVQTLLDKWVGEINSGGAAFLKGFLCELSEQELTTDEQLKVISLAIRTIEADNRIEYSEIKFFKKIRFRLSVSDEEILELHPDKEDFLLSDIMVAEDPVWEDIQFSDIILTMD